MGALPPSPRPRREAGKQVKKTYLLPCSLGSLFGVPIKGKASPQSSPGPLARSACGLRLPIAPLTEERARQAERSFFLQPVT
jgi:hypothetical protein